jgi:ABC-type branched-subunit amino acid transport system substrate-binding protein
MKTKLWVATLFFVASTHQIDLIFAAPKKKSIKVCHVSTLIDHLLPSANDMKMRYSGFDLAIKSFNDRNSNGAFHATLEVISAKNKQITIFDLLNEAKTRNCNAIVGLVTSRDALLSGPILKQIGIIGISSTAVHDDISKFYPHVISLANSATTWAKSLAQQMHKTKTHKVYIFKKEADVFSATLTSALEWQLKNLNVNYEKIEDIDPSVASKWPLTRSSMVFTTYPVISIEHILRLIQVQNKEMTIFGNPSWMERHTFSALAKKLKAVDNIFVSAPWHNEYTSTAGEKFFKSYKEHYSKKPDHDTAYNYDATTLALECLTKYKSGPCQIKNLKFTGATGYYEFLNSSHAIRPELIRQIKIDDNIL